MTTMRFQRTTTETHEVYRLQGVLDLPGVERLVRVIEGSTQRLSLLVRLDVSGLISAEPAAVSTITNWIDEVNRKFTFVEIIGDWPKRESPPTFSSLPMFSIRSAGCSEPSSDGIRFKVATEPKRDADAEVAIDKRSAEPPEREVGRGIRRFCSIRYFRKMYPNRHYPVNVLFTESQLRKVQLRHVADLVNAAVVELDNDDTTVEVRIVFPGCVSAPAVSWVDLSAKGAIARFWVTPISIGDIKHAYVEIWYRDALLSRIDTPAKIVRQRKAIASMVLGFLMPLVSVGAKLYADEFRQAIPSAGQQAVDMIGSFLAGPLIAVWSTLLLLSLAVVYFVTHLPKKASPIESTLSV